MRIITESLTKPFIQNNFQNFRINVVVKCLKRMIKNISFALCNYAVTFSICLKLNTFGGPCFYQSCQIVEVLFPKKMTYGRSNYKIHKAIKQYLHFISFMLKRDVFLIDCNSTIKQTGQCGLEDVKKLINCFLDVNSIV